MAIVTAIRKAALERLKTEVNKFFISNFPGLRTSKFKFSALANFEGSI